MYSTPFLGRSSIKKFECFETNIDTKTLLEDFIEGKKTIDVSNQKLPSAHRESTHIGLRLAQKTKFTKNFYYGNLLKIRRTAEYALFPKITAWIEQFAEKHDATLERAFIAILQPHGKVYCHFDAGIYYASRERHHLVLQSEGTTVYVENENRIFNEGEVWWFNSRLYHEFLHTSDKERIHVIFDLRPKSFTKRVRNILIWLYIFCVHRLQGAGRTGSPPKAAPHVPHM